MEDEVQEIAPPVTKAPLPAVVAKAIVEVMSGVPKLAKDEKNEQARYTFAGIDAFLEAVRPLCVKAGLIIAQDEIDFTLIEIAGKSQGMDKKIEPWFQLRYQFTLSHASGETWSERPIRTIAVRAIMGSQAFGAAQSYALKLFMRSLFQIATGDEEDVDREPEKKSQPKPALHGPLNITALKDKLRGFARDVQAVEDLASLTDLEEKFRPVSDQAMMDLPGWWYGTEDSDGAIHALNKKRKQLMSRENTAASHPGINDPAQQGPIE